jgi:chromosome segregation ATPase
MVRNKKTASAETTMLRADLAALRTDIEALRTDIEQRFNRGAAVIAKVAAESGLDTGLRTDIEALRTDIEALHVHIEALRADTERRFTHLESKLESEIDQKPNVTTIFLTMLTGALAIVIVVIVAAALMSL